MNFRHPAPIGECIYCGERAGKLTGEHVIPFGLGGRFVLPESTCRKCADKTSALERSVQRVSFLEPRAALKLPTRRPKARPSTFPFRVRRRDSATEEIIEFPAEEMVGVAVFLLLNPPAFLTNSEYKSGVTVKGCVLVQVGRPDLQAFAEQHNLASLQGSTTYAGNNFERVLCKIAYGFGVAAFGLGAFSKVFVIPTILGEVDDAGRWVGCMSVEPSPPTHNLHEVSLGLKGRLVVARVRLFAKFGAPEYTVVVGEAR